jgi:hypothetical protein
VVRACAADAANIVAASRFVKRGESRLMSAVDKAVETQLKNIRTKTGKTLDELYALIRASGLAKHGEIRDMLKRDLAMGHGDANTIVHFYMKAAEGQAAESAGAAAGDPLDEIYSGPKAHLRPIHDKLMAAIHGFGALEIAPKKAYISLRRKKQFATIGPATKTRVEVGLNMKGVPGTERLLALPPGGMCQYKVNVTDAGEVDAELIGWIRQAYDSAG